MIAMQYEFAFPAGHEMAAIAQRVADKGHLFDDWPGLVFKAFLVASEQDAELAGSGNAYAPFYLWADAAAMADFLASEAFAGVSGAFGRPLVNAWVPVFQGRKATLAHAAFVTRQKVVIERGKDLSVVWQAEREAAEGWLVDPSVEAVVVGVDASRWEGVRVVFHRRPALILADGGVQQYRLLHLSQPG